MKKIVYLILYLVVRSDTQNIELSKTNTYFPADYEPQFMPSNGVGTNISDHKCGSHPVLERNLHGGEADIGEFPWMVLIEYRKNGERQLNCAGSIINQRYVVTAAHCVTSTFTNLFGTPRIIRLGEHDTNSRIDCIDNKCNMEIVEIGIEKIIIHENFVETSRNKENDIALMRLNQNIPSNPFIEPICLPSAVGYQKSQRGTNLVVAGWGATIEEKSSNIKLKVTLPVVTQNECSDKYSKYGVVITNTQVCAGGNYLQNSCSGDDGGPLMAFNDNNWVLEGIISFGYFCTVEGWPSVYTRIHDYEYWIKENLEP